MNSVAKNIDCMLGMAEYPDKKEKKRLRAQKYYAKNKDRIYLRNKQKRESNRESHNAYRNNYRTKNPSGIYDVLKQGAKKRNIAVTVSREDFVNWYKIQDRVCFYCKRDEPTVINDNHFIIRKAKRLTIDRMNNDRGYENDNLALCCQRCNNIKSNYFTVDEMLLIGQIIKSKK